MRAWYGAAQILFDLSFEVASGEVVALMGRNGAGKTTTLRALMELMAQRSGTIRFLGEDISRLKPFEIARRGVGYVPEDRRIFSDLTVLENLDIGRQPPRLWSRRPSRCRMDAGATVQDLSQPRHHAEPAGREHERRRAADVDRGAHADGQPAPRPPR